MAEAATKMPVRNEGKAAERPAEWRPFESLRREVDRLFEDFQLGSWRAPFGRNLSRSSRSGGARSPRARRPPSTSSTLTRPTRSQPSCRGWTRATSMSNSPTAR
jgi:hypothetical protein